MSLKLKSIWNEFENSQRNLWWYIFHSPQNLACWIKQITILEGHPKAKTTILPALLLRSLTRVLLTLAFQHRNSKCSKQKKIFLFVNQRAHLSSSHLLLKRGSGTNETLLKNLPHGRTITKLKINKKQGKYLTSDLLKTASSSDFYATFGLTAAVSETWVVYSVSSRLTYLLTRRHGEFDYTNGGQTDVLLLDVGTYMRKLCCIPAHTLLPTASTACLLGHFWQHTWYHPNVTKKGLQNQNKGGFSTSESSYSLKTYEKDDAHLLYRYYHFTVIICVNVHFLLNSVKNENSKKRVGGILLKNWLWGTP